MATTAAEAIASASRSGYVEAPAGYGKTETIAEAVLLSTRPQLVLTHTHAGVDSLHKRLRAKGVPSGRYRLETIDSFSLKFAGGYPRTSGYAAPAAGGVDWVQARQGAKKVVELPAVREHLRSAYGGVIVDEYQDCSIAQHAVILALASIRPVRILGDPLQRLFTFDKSDACVSWKEDVEPHFEKLGELTTPHRWLIPGADPALGEWLKSARVALATREVPSYGPPVTVHAVSPETELFSAIKRVGTDTERVVVLVPMKHQMEKVASRLSRLGYSCMEEIEGKDLLAFCQRAERLQGCQLAAAIIEFVADCTTQPDQRLDTILRHLKTANLAALGRCQPKVAVDFLCRYGSGFTLADAPALIDLTANLPGRRVMRRELLTALKQSLSLHRRRQGVGFSLLDAAREVRQRISHRGRKDELRLVSRPVLVKGLQYEHVVVVDPHTFDAEELYVALSRGTKSVAVVGTNLGELRQPKGGGAARSALRPSVVDRLGSHPSLFDPMED